MEKNGILFYFFQVKMFLLLQAVQLFPVMLPVENAAAVEEHHPYPKSDESDGIFVEYYPENFLKHVG